MDLKEIDILGDEINRHWYYASKAKAMLSFLGDDHYSTIVDVGAGSGYFSQFLLNHTNTNQAWCVDISYESDFNEQLKGKSMFYRRSIDSIEADLVLFMDVLEHVDDDVGLLKEYVNKVPQKSRFFITVPAFQFLWSGHDIFLEHKRRYTIKQLENTVQNAGLKIIQSNYYFGIVFPIAASVRFLQNCFARDQKASSQLVRHNVLSNNLFKVLCSIELPFIKINRLAGLSVFCLAEKAD